MPRGLLRSVSLGLLLLRFLRLTALNIVRLVHSVYVADQVIQKGVFCWELIYLALDVIHTVNLHFIEFGTVVLPLICFIELIT